MNIKMKNFKILNHLTTYDDLEQQLEVLLNERSIEWHYKHNQICLNTIDGREEDYLLGTGSLLFDWDKSTNNKTKLDVPLKKNVLNEKDFTNLCIQFKGTIFEEIYKELDTYYILGRVRLIRSLPKTCMSWHKDTSIRIHYPIKTQEGCFMVIDDEVKHLEKNKWWWTNTLLKHTAVNSSKEFRVHLVVCVLGEK
jgi:hypothetical protein